MKKLLALILAVLMMVACFAGCGSETFKIGVQTTTTGDIYASGDFGEDAVTRYDNGAAAVEALKAGKVDVVIIDNEPAKSYVAANEGLKILETAYAEEEYAICFQKGDADLKNAVDGALKALIDDGSVKKIVDKYINDSGSTSDLVGVPVAFEDTDKPNLVMATNAEFPPYEYIDGDKYYGIDVEVAKIIADKPRLVLLDLTNGVRSVQNDHLSAEISNACVMFIKDRTLLFGTVSHRQSRSINKNNLHHLAVQIQRYIAGGEDPFTAIS